MSFGLRSVALRYFNAAGADPDGELGEDHDPETHLIPLAISAAMGLVPALRDLRHRLRHAGWNRDPRLPARHRSRRSARRCAALSGGRAEQSTAINLGTGRGYSVREVTRWWSRFQGAKCRFAKWAAARETRLPDSGCIEIGQRDGMAARSILARRDRPDGVGLENKSGSRRRTC